jgi:hypothetical protein
MPPANLGIARIAPPANLDLAQMASIAANPRLAAFYGRKSENSDLSDLELTVWGGVKPLILHPRQSDFSVVPTSSASR